MKRKTLITIGLLILSIICHAQSAVQEADRAFASGNYSDAIQLYEMAASTLAGNEGERNRLYLAANKCRKIISLHTKANKDYQAQRFEEAMASYEAILKYNPKDFKANSRKKEYTNKVIYAKENTAWEEVCSQVLFSDKAAKATEYISRFPEGRFKNEADEIIAEEALWKKAGDANTYNGYKMYLQTSKLGAYREEAENSINILDDMLWANAKRKNNKAGYLEYTNQQKDRDGRHLEEAKCLYNLMYARELFYKGDYFNAYDYYIAAKNHLNEYDKKDKSLCLEHRYYKKACSDDGTINDCNIYLSKYDHRDKYYYLVNNRLMKLLCNEGRFEEAKNHARTKNDFKYVKQAKKSWKKTHKR